MRHEALFRNSLGAQVRALAKLFVIFLVAVAALPGTLSAASSGGDEKRVALVIGNGAYPTGPLPNPPNDARLIAASLREVGFEVIERIDVDQRAMKRAIMDFGLSLRAAGPDAVGLFFFAGHGLQINGENFLVPLRAEIAAEADVDLETVAASSILRQMEGAGNRINMVILDACRDNPYKRSFRSTSRGLARLEAPRGSYVAYATAPGDVAADGAGKNSPFSSSLAASVRIPGLSVEAMFKKVRLDVLKATGNRQTPWDSSSLTGDFYFTPPQAPAEATAQAPSPAAEVPHPSPAGESNLLALELTFWQSVKDSRNLADIEEYLRQFPSGRFSGLARNRLAEVKSAPAPASPSAGTGAERTPQPKLPPAPPHECDQRAALPGAPFGPGVPLQAIAAAEAVRACQHAIQQFPEEPRFWSWLGRAFERGNNPDSAYLWYRRAANQGLAEDQNTVGRMLQEGRGTSRDESEAAQWYRKAADQGHADAQNNLGILYQTGHGVEPSMGEAARLYRRAAEQGHAFAQNNLGVLYQHGRGVTADAAEAARWYRRAADQGNPFGQNNLGLLYQKGQGVAANETEAAAWFAKAAAQGFAPAQNNLGLNLLHGRGVARNDGEAAQWFRKAADQGVADAQNSLGLMYQNGLGVTRSVSEAIKWYRRAVAQGHADAQNNLAVLYQTGQGVPRNEDEARRLYRLAADQGNPYARTNLLALEAARAKPSP